jgi:hypothetical protein
MILANHCEEILMSSKSESSSSSISVDAKIEDKKEL